MPWAPARAELLGQRTASRPARPLRAVQRRAAPGLRGLPPPPAHERRPSARGAGAGAADPPDPQSPGGRAIQPPGCPQPERRPCPAFRLTSRSFRESIHEGKRPSPAGLPDGPIRDLFEGYLPQPEPAARKLGSNPRPRAILALRGDAGRGEKLFWSKALECCRCHRIGERGTAVGPDLSAIGKLRGRENLLESILEPSRRIEPKYAAYVAQTADGRSLTGLLVRRDDSAVVLRDAQNKEIVLAAADIERLQPTPLSLMPDGQLAGLTAQEAADLLEYLATRK